MKFLKKLGVLSLVIIVLLGLNGCMGNNNNNNNNNNSKNIRTQALEYMEKKYGEKFEYRAPYGNSMLGTLKFLASCGSLPGKNVIVQVANYTREDRVFSDNYIAVKYQQQSLNFFKECAIKVFGEANAFYTSPFEGSSTNLSKDATFEQFLSDTLPVHLIYIEVKKSDYRNESQLKEIAKLIGEHGTHYVLQVVIVKDKLYGTNDEDTIQRTLGKKDIEQRAIIDNSKGTPEIQWFGD